jgi:hypothetical protein
MARFMGTVQGGRGRASRLGHPETGLTVKANGWDAGVRVEARVELERDVFYVWATGGSHAVEPDRLIATVKAAGAGAGGEIIWNIVTGAECEVVKAKPATCNARCVPGEHACKA